MRMRELILLDDIELVLEQLKRHKTLSLSTFNELRKLIFQSRLLALFFSHAMVRIGYWRNIN